MQTDDFFAIKKSRSEVHHPIPLRGLSPAEKEYLLIQTTATATHKYSLQLNYQNGKSTLPVAKGKVCRNGGFLCFALFNLFIEPLKPLVISWPVAIFP